MKKWMMNIFLAVAMTTLISGCRTARMAIPPGLTTIPEMPVEGLQGWKFFNERFSFGPYEADDISRGWTSKTSLGFMGYSKNKAKQNYEFTLTNLDTHNANVAQCSTGVNWQDIESMVLGGTLSVNIQARTVFACSFKSNASTWQLIMGEGTNDGTLSGELTDGVSHIEISGTTKLAGTPLPLIETAGYNFRMGGMNIAAVEIINQGAVWIVPGLSEDQKMAVATAASALLLYQNLQE